MTFLLCSSCKRHIKSDATCCPFCGTSAALATPAGHPETLGARTRSRLLFGAAAGVVAAGLASCGDATTGSVYGAPCIDDPCVGVQQQDGGHGFTVDAEAFDGAVVDASPPTDASDDADAAELDGAADVDAADVADE